MADEWYALTGEHASSGRLGFHQRKGSMERYVFTPEQERAIGELVTDRWGDNFQTGVLTSGSQMGMPFLYSQTGPNYPTRRAVIAPDGTVMFDA